MRRFRLILVVALLTAPLCAQPAAPAQFDPRLPPAWQSRCAEALKTPLPPEAAVAPKPDTSNQSADSAYYGLETAPDYVAARHLGWQERAAVPTHPGGYGMFTGTLPLTMIYANGLGTPRDPALALRLGCEATLYPNSLTAADLDALTAILNSKASPRPMYDICAPNSPEIHNQGLCGTLAASQERKRILDTLAALSAHWTPQQRSQLAALEKAALRFIGGSGIYEVPIVEPGKYPATEDNFNATRRDGFDLFLTRMQSFVSQPPASSPSAPSDSALNRAYHILTDRLRARGKEMPPTVVLDPMHEWGIEHDWLAYRDAWTTLATSLFGPDRAAAWRTSLTAERTQTLAQLSAAFGPPNPKAQPWLSLCNRVESTPLPSGIAAQPSRPSFPVCSAYKPYYGIGGRQDFATARTCAIAERNLIRFNRNPSINDGTDPAGEIGEEINGSGMLAMIYANGEGVPRNIPLAERFACEAIDAGQIAPPDAFPSDEESEALIPNLFKTIASPRPSLDLCDFVPALGRMEDECQFIASIRSAQEQTAELATIGESFTPAQKTAYQRLLDALHAYLAAHDRNEIAVMPHLLNSGAWHGVHAERERAFLTDLTAFEAGKLPHDTAADNTAADQALNVAYSKLLLNSPDKESGTNAHNSGDEPTRASLRTTERLWIAYRDAFADFGTLRYPSISRATWLAFVTQQRTKDLNDSCFLDANC